MSVAETRPRLSGLSPAADAHVRLPLVPGRRPLRLGLVAFFGAGAVFVLIQDLLALHFVHALRAAASHRSGGIPPGLLSVGHHLTQAAFEASIVYLGFAGAGLVLAFLGRRTLFVVPALSFVVYGVAVGYGHLPQPIGAQWNVGCASGCAAWFSNPWIGATLGLVFVLLPGAVVALTVPGRRWPDRLDAPAVAGIGVALAATVVAYRTAVIVNGSAALPETITVASFALLAGTAKRWWPWAHVLVALVLSGGAWVLVWNAMYPDAPGGSVAFLSETSVPLLAVALLASSWQPIAALLRRSRSQPFGLLIAANLLNVADAGLTALAVDSGKALEINPVVTWMGLPAKVIFVAGLTWFLYRRRASALIWSVAALFAVLCYHVSGMVVNR
jgi:hypothetical protein